MGRGPVRSFGVKMTVWSLTPSRMGIMNSDFSNRPAAEAWAQATKMQNATFPVRSRNVFFGTDAIVRQASGSGAQNCHGVRRANFFRFCGSPKMQPDCYLIDGIGLGGGPDRTRICDLYRVKVAL